MNPKIKYKLKIILILITLGMLSPLLANGPNRVGTTTANFLEIGYGAAATAMGDAYVSAANDISAVYWNPAGLAFMEQNEALFMIQPWVLDINTSFLAAGVPVSGIGTFALNIIHVGYGDMEVTTLSRPEGTGEIFDANEFALSASFARAITSEFAFGATVKYISSQIWHMTGTALAFDLGVQIKSGFFSPTENVRDGLNIGMSISNYGSKLQYDGIDLINPIDILPDENGNYRDVPGQFRLSSWELPLIFRVGVSLKPIVLDNQSLLVSIDALHPNNNTESLNLGVQYQISMAGFGKLFVRGGYKALFMEESEYGTTFGAGFTMNLLKNTSIKCDYAYRSMGILGSVNSFGLGLGF
jgi:hypothetical protein